MARVDLTWLSLTLLTLLGTGCAESGALRRSLAVPYQPRNVHCADPFLPATLRRVAVLPLSAAPGEAAQTGRATLEPVLLAELRKCAAFEVFAISRDQLRAWTGREDLTQQDVLPDGFFATIRTQTACDAVLFSHLSGYRPYPPLAVGWSLRLTDSQTMKTCWAIDELFDAGSTEVIVAAQSYYRSEVNQPSSQLDSTGILNSPRRFGQYTLAATLATLPPRPGGAAPPAPALVDK